MHGRGTSARRYLQFSAVRLPQHAWESSAVVGGKLHSLPQSFSPYDILAFGSDSRPLRQRVWLVLYPQLLASHPGSHSLRLPQPVPALIFLPMPAALSHHPWRSIDSGLIVG